MITVQMTEVEYKAYQLYMKSIKVMLKEGKTVSRKSSLDEYLADSENSKELEAGLEDVKAGRITYIDPENIWENH
jgi:bacterioferritin (cytochrome b1)